MPFGFGGGIIGTDQLADGAVTNAKVAAAAAIVASKLADGGHFAAAAPHSGHLKVSAVLTYTGDNTTNRAIPHGLGVVPKFALMFYTAYGYTGMQIVSTTQTVEANAISYVMTVTAWDATNIYVGASGVSEWNQNTIAYTVIVIG